MEELARSAEIIGYDGVVMLGYRDSGMPGRRRTTRSRCFAQADLDEAVGRLVAVIREERPHVIVTYGDDQERLPAPRPPPGARHQRRPPSTPPATPTATRSRASRGSR